MLCDQVSGNINDVQLGIGSDKRIGKNYLNAGLGNFNIQVNIIKQNYRLWWILFTERCYIFVFFVFSS